MGSHMHPPQGISGSLPVQAALSLCPSAALSGVLLNTAFAGLSLILSGVLKIVYDVSLLWAFRYVKPPEER